MPMQALAADLARYAVYGLTVESAFPLGTLPSPPGDGQVDVRILRAAPGTFAGFDASASETTWYRREVLADGSIYLGIPDVLQAIISADGRTARCAPAPEGDPRSFEANVLNFVLTAALTLQGEEPFHATVVRLDDRAVGFLGDSGTGKSTLAAFLLAEGAELVTDDMLRIVYDADEAMAWRGPPRLKLFDEQARLLLPAAMSRCRVQSDERQAAGRGGRTARRRRSVVGAVLARRTGGQRRDGHRAARAGRGSDPGSCSPRPCIATIVRRIASSASCASSSGWRKSVPIVRRGVSAPA